MSTFLRPEQNIAEVYKKGVNSNQEFIRTLTIFITSFLKQHLVLLENGDDTAKQTLGTALNFLLRISQVDDTVIFKICLEYWNILVADLYNTQRLSGIGGGQQLLAGRFAAGKQQAPRVKVYAEILSLLRRVMIGKMAKPEEVLIVEDDNGEIVREMMKDTDAIILYKSMRECLIYLTHLDTVDAEKTMLDKLQRQVDGQEWSWHNLNTLCWAIGSISGALTELQEKQFLVRVIKDLLGMCEQKRGKDHKAVIASNIMYVVGQYPRFLKQHWRFLKTVVNKLFEFMHEKHPGVQDMSCDTFLKIAKKCRKKFVQVQVNENRPFIDEILSKLGHTIKDLEQSQIYTFYEAVGNIIQSQSDPEEQQRLVLALMDQPNMCWNQIITRAKHDNNHLSELKTIKDAILVLKTNNRVASSLGHGYSVQLGRIFLEMLQVYRFYSASISDRLAAEGPDCTKTVIVRNMRTVKKETLRLIQTFIANCQESDKPTIMKNFLPALMEPVLGDYKQAKHPEARDAEVLLLYAEAVSKLGLMTMDMIPQIFEATFECTLGMINHNYSDFPDHRINFFKLLRAINSAAFPALLRLEAAQFELVIKSISWALRHLERNIADTGLNILLELLQNVQKSEVANDFYTTYFITVLQEVLDVLSDTFHKPGFRLQAQILAQLFHVVEAGSITVPLWANRPDTNGQQYQNNQLYVRDFTIKLLLSSFQNLTQPQVQRFVQGLFEFNTNQPKFKTHLRDFLVNLKEFGGDTDDLFLDEKQARTLEQQQMEQNRVESVPGLKYMGPTQTLPTQQQDDEFGDM